MEGNTLNQSAKLTSFNLSGPNYLLWTRAAKTALCSRGLWGYASKSKVKPKEEDKSYEEWFQKDQIALALIQNSLDYSIFCAHSFIDTSAELWEALKKSYGNINNLCRVYEIKCALSGVNQDGKAVVECYGELQVLWAELQTLRPPTTNVETLAARTEQDKCFSLFSALDPCFDNIIHHILRMNEMPSFEEVYGMIQKEEAAIKFRRNKMEGIAHKSQEMSTKKCQHCGRINHSKEVCWELYPHLRPKKFREDRRNQRTVANSANHVKANDGSPVSGSRDMKGEVQAILKELGIIKDNGNSKSLLSVDHSLVVDSGASNHMIKDKKLIKNVKPYSGIVSIANGQGVSIKGTGDIRIFDKDTKALYMPDFSSNLLSVRKIAKDLNCAVRFLPDKVDFQDIETGRLLGEGEVEGDIYILRKFQNNSNSIHALASVDSSLWHARLGHPHTKALSILLPKEKFDHEKCEACILGKHCRTVFSDSSTEYSKCSS